MCVVSWVGGGGPALGGSVEWPRSGARGVCRQVRVVGVASRGLSLYGGVSWYATDAGGLGWPAVVSAVLYGAYSYVLCLMATLWL